MWYWSDNMGWMMLFGGIWFIIFWAVVIGLVVWAVRQFTQHRGSGAAVNPLDIAKERYARGEITKEQFEQIKKDLS